MSAEPHLPLASGRVRVDEAPLRRRVRRPRDLLRAILGVIVVVLLVFAGSIAVGTAAGLEQDLVGVTSGAPRLLLQLVTFIATVGVLALPVVAALDLVLRHRAGQILDAIVGAAVCVVVTTSLTTWITSQQPARVLEALTKVLPDGTRSQSLNHVVAAVVAFLVVADLAGRTRMRAAGMLTVGAVLLSSVLSGRVTLLSVVVSLLIGGTIGLAVRYAFGTFSTRPDGLAVAHALNHSGLGVTELIAQPEVAGATRQYVATRDDGRAYDVVVLDRDKEGAGIVGLIWRQIRIIGPATRTRAVAVRSTLEHDALVSYALSSAGVATPKLVVVSEISEDAAVLAYEQSRGRPFSELLESEVSDALLADLWTQHALMLRARIAHRGLTRERILVHDDDTSEITDLRYAVVAATELQLRLDTTELLVSLALTVGSERAVKSGVMYLGSDDIADALPLLQPLALTPSTRRAARDTKGLLRDVRTAVIAATPNPPTEAAQLQRISGRAVLLARRSDHRGVLPARPARPGEPRHAVLQRQLDVGRGGGRALGVDVRRSDALVHRLRARTDLVLPHLRRTGRRVVREPDGAVEPGWRGTERALPRTLGTRTRSRRGDGRRLAGRRVRHPPRDARAVRRARRIREAHRHHTVAEPRPDHRPRPRCGHDLPAAADRPTDHARPRPPDARTRRAATDRGAAAAGEARDRPQRQPAAQPQLRVLSRCLRARVRQRREHRRDRSRLPRRFGRGLGRPDPRRHRRRRGRARGRSHGGGRQRRGRGLVGPAVPTDHVLDPDRAGLAVLQLPAAPRTPVTDAPRTRGPARAWLHERPADVIDVFVYVVVLNLAIQYLPAVISETFTLSLLTAVLLKVALEVVIRIKTVVVGRFRAATTPRGRTIAAGALWVVAAGSKLVVLELVNLVFGDSVSLGNFFSVTLLVVALLLSRAAVRRLLA